MTITLHWWILPLALGLAAVGLPMLLRTQGDYDFATPMIQLTIFGVCVAGAIGILVGHFFG